MNRVLALALGLALAGPVLSASPVGMIDDSDFSDPVLSAQDRRFLGLEGRPAGTDLVFSARAERSPRAGAARAITGNFLLHDRAGAKHPARLACAEPAGAGAPAKCESVDESGKFELSVPANPSGSYKVRFKLNNRYWAFINPDDGGSYLWESPAFTLPAEGGLDLGPLSPEPASANGKLGVLHLTYVEALDFLKARGDLSWWNKPLTVNWPGSADFFSPWGWSLDLTNALAWDVVLHELGHAVMHGAFKAASAGGQHKIDECYSAALAWSEGWATFFAGAVRLSPADPDARFEFLVPRRAPIRLENVPEDVCRGETNEWRVAAGLWDLHDTHADGADQLSLGFSPLWKGFTGGRTSSLSTAWELVAKGLNPIDRRAGQAALAHNSLLPAPAGIEVPMPEPPAGWAAPR